MSLKPEKKSDLGKSWMKPRKDRHIKIQPEYHLIVSEGTDTEPAYFKALKNQINVNYPGRIRMDIHGRGESTVSLFEKARNLAETSPNVYKHVWVIFDTDDFPPADVNKTVELCNKETNSETYYHALWSNQCIELWFLLHFSYFHSDIHRRDYWPKLSKKLTELGKGTYRKNRDDMFEILQPFIANAVSNAERLDRDNAGKTPSASAPGTRVYKLVKLLLPYLQAGYITDNEHSEV